MPNNFVKFDDRKVMRMVKNLPDRIERKVLRQATGPALTPVLKEAKRLCPVGDNGLLKKSLIKKLKTYKGSQTVVGIVGPRTNLRVIIDGKPHKPSNYAHLVEDGVKPHQIKVTRKSGQVLTIDHPGFSGRHFLKRAGDNKLREAKNIAQSRIASGVISEGQKLGL